MAMAYTRGRKALRWLILCVACMFALALISNPAFADYYEVNAVDIDATVNPDGSLSVVQQRTYDLEGTFSGIYWDVPRGTYRGREIDASINWVGAITKEGLILFEEGYDGAPGTYELTDGGDYWGLKLYWPASNEAVTFQVSYDAPNLVSRWSDVGELYWQYVVADASSEGAWKNVTLRVQLPVPDGATVTPGENVRAWGHGPIDGSVAFESDGVRYFSPGVGAAEFLEARITFPGEWLTAMEPEGEAHLEEILAEEDQWAKDANAMRRKARMIVYGIPGSMVLIAIGSILAMLGIKNRVKKNIPKPQFDDTYFRDVPTNDHPAVLGMLYRRGTADHKDFSASLMRLADQGRITLDTVMLDRQTKRGKTRRQPEWRMILHKDAEGRATGNLRAGGKAIDDAAFAFLHDVVADKLMHSDYQSQLGTNGQPYVIKEFFDEAAETWPEAYSRGYDKWDKAVRSAFDKRKFEIPTDNSEIVTGLLGLGDFALAVILAIVGMLLGVPSLWICLAFIVLFGAGIAIVMLDEDTPANTLSQEAVEIVAQLEALKRWLTDFTRLEEAIPTDVVLWNRLLVMATVLGVADKVVKQLQVYAPKLVQDPAFSAIDWYKDDLDERLDYPLVVFTRSISSGKSTSSSKLYHETSSYDTSSSYDSSSRGSGGGFSSGGGGGYSGGGGRGGAF